MTVCHILPGSLELEGTILRAGIHSGISEWSFYDLRYVEVDISNEPESAEILEILTKVYENSTGSLTHDDFKMNETLGG